MVLESVLDFMGFAQKFGTVISYIRIGDEPASINQVRIEQGRADALIGCDLVVSSSPRASVAYDPGHTRALVNTAEMTTADFVKHRDANMQAPRRIKAIGDVVGKDNLSTLDANALAEQLLGNTIYANVMMLGCAWQQGLVPVSLDALKRAIELNGVEIEKNKQAFDWGRVAAVNPAALDAGAAHGREPNDDRAHGALLQDIIERRADFLVDYQDQALADRYLALIDRVRDADASDDALVEAVAKSYFKLLAYKDEYEVARLHTQTGFLDDIRASYGDKARITFHMAPPIVTRKKDARGRPVKREFGRGTITLFRILARLRRLRGTPFDIFGYSHDRRVERALIAEFEGNVDRMLADLTADNRGAMRDMVAAYMDIRGYGPVKDQAVADVSERIRAIMRE